MIRGEVSPFRFGEVEITVRGSAGKPDQTLKAIIDTGFDGGISLPPTLIAQLDLPYFDKKPSIVFGGAEIKFDVYWAVVLLGELELPISAIAADNPPLVGMSLLYGLHLSMDIVDGGQVVIRQLPTNENTGNDE